MKRLLDYDPQTGIRTYHEYDHSSGKTHIEEVQDVRPHLEYSKRLQRNTDYRKSGMKGDNMMHVAHVPAVIVQKLITDYHLDPYSNDEKELEKVLKTIQRDFPHLMPSGKAYS